jgi:hypothetical protein
LHAVDPLSSESRGSPPLYALEEDVARRDVLSCGLRIRVTDPALVPSLLDFLSGQVNCVAEQVSEREVEVSLLGSYDSEMHDLAVTLLVRAWEAADPRRSDRGANTS